MTVPHPLSGRHIVLGVTGSIACYKAPDLASKLAQAGCLVDTILTEEATRFVTPLTFQSVTGRPAYTHLDLWGDRAHVLHVSLGREADLVVIAPATAHTLARLAHGMADDLIAITVLAATCPLLVAPAMDGGMFDHPATQRNLATLRERGVVVAGPEEGHLASGMVARGRMSEPAALFGQVRYLLSRGGPLAGRTLVVTAGGTQEPIDPVRILTNLSSGKQGYALAQAALDAGAQVTLVTAPTALTPPTGADVIQVRTANQMAEAVLAACQEADALLMAAAVADFRPTQVAGQKIKRAAGAPVVLLEPNPDILKSVHALRRQLQRPKVVVGFAAETQQLEENARSKLDSKGLDLMVANDVSATDAGFQVDSNRVTLLSPGGAAEPLPLMSKAAVAAAVLERVINLLRE